MSNLAEIQAFAGLRIFASARPVEELRARLVELQKYAAAVQDKADKEGRQCTAIEMRQINDAFDEFEQIEAEITASQAEGMRTRMAAPQGRRTAPDPLPLQPGQNRGFMNQMWRGVQDNLQGIRSTPGFQFEIQAAATDPITTGDGRAISGIGPQGPGPIKLGSQYAFGAGGSFDVGTIEYSRWTGQQGSVAVQAAEGSTKSAVRPSYSLVTIAALTVAGYCRVSAQALDDMPSFQSAVQAQMLRSYAQSLDSILIGGSGAGWPGLAALATAHVSTTYTRLADATSEASAAMAAAGFMPDRLILSPKAWLSVMTLQGGADGLYLSGSYINALPENLRGLQIVMSPALGSESPTLGSEAIVLDSSQCVLGVRQGFNIRTNYADDDFIKNLLTIRGEGRVMPMYYSVGAARLVTKKA